MKIAIMKPLRIIAVLFLFVVSVTTGHPNALVAEDLQKFAGATLLSNPNNDGDSFHVKAAGKEMCIRLYFVDCPEVFSGSKSDARHILKQASYFGLSDPKRVIHFGKMAKEFVVDSLSSGPFTVYTAFASAPGRSSIFRIPRFLCVGSWHPPLWSSGYGKSRTQCSLPMRQRQEVQEVLPASAPTVKRPGVLSRACHFSTRLHGTGPLIQQGGGSYRRRAPGGGGKRLPSTLDTLS
jgi:hypothetical protein